MATTYANLLQTVKKSKITGCEKNNERPLRFFGDERAKEPLC